MLPENLCSKPPNALGESNARSPPTWPRGAAIGVECVRFVGLIWVLSPGVGPPLEPFIQEQTPRNIFQAFHSGKIDSVRSARKSAYSGLAPGRTEKGGLTYALTLSLNKVQFYFYTQDECF